MSVDVMGYVPVDVSLAEGDDVNELLLTYAELAEHMGIKVESAKKAAQRRKWMRVVGNDGMARVRVPAEVLSVRVGGDVEADVSPDVSLDVGARLAHLEGLVEGLKGQIEAEKRRAEAAEARNRDLEGDREAWRKLAQRSLWQRLFGK